jgi:exonuclease 3'-5' domain-containing protein 1
MTTSIPDWTLIDSILKLRTFLSTILTSDLIYLDIEGLNLGRHGTVSILTIMVHPSNKVQLIDVSVLGDQTFSIASKDGQSLKSILGDQSIRKYIWDVRNDADALWSCCGVNLAGVTDIQLLENASRSGNKTYVHGLKKCVQEDLKLSVLQTNRWLRTKTEGQKLMETDIFSIRPMNDNTVQYCQNDVIHLPDLCATYMARIHPEWLIKAKEESERRIIEAQSPEYDPKSESKKLGPWGSGGEKCALTIDEMCDMWEEERIEAFMNDMLGNDGDLGCYSDFDYDQEGPGDYEDWGALDSDWDKN